MTMKKVVIAVSLFLGMALASGGCGQDEAITPDEGNGQLDDGALGEVEQALCAPLCATSGTVWTGCSAPTAACPGGEQQERYVCLGGGDGGPTCRRRCCLID
jgi:hypothetical protein